jgi:uncharacterized protein (DUF2147 family)
LLWRIRAAGWSAITPQLLALSDPALHKPNILLCRRDFKEILMASRFAVALACLLALAGFANGQTATDPTGTWLTQNGDARVRVSKCGAGICGVVVWLRDPNDPATGKPQVDDKNPNPSLARRPMIGLPLFSSMQSTGPGKWSGKIYNADDGGTYASNVSVAGPDSLKVEGCLGAFCGGENWSRVR